ncbi:pericentrin isoform X2 [Pteropus vampyrus]|uniref:Pericentrin isoform X2 n=1 Tax=Pteropus vampyrus TaxID=132908 RepID=A0A6P6C357_PTEVA|nr:pericentrin isoform X2 [Pteropus vampyrus]
MEDEQEQRRRKVEAGRAKLAQFRQRKTKGDCAHSKKKTAKGKSSAVAAPVPEERPVAPEGGALLGGGDARQSAACSGALDEAGATQDCEQAREPEVAEPMSRHGDETDGQQPTMAVQLQTQPAPPLELEALRLSLSHMHTARLELTQATLQKEKEAALTELRDTLSGRHAQELALLQSRWRLELELAREQHAREREVLVRRRCQETAELEEKLQSEVEKNVQAVEILKRDWESERDQCLENLRKELSAQHQSEVDHLRSQFEKELAEQKAELEKTFQAKNQAEWCPLPLQAQQEAIAKELQEHVESEPRLAEDPEWRDREEEGGGRLEVENPQTSRGELQTQSQEVQFESTGSDGQVLSESRAQPLAPASHAGELARLRQDFEQQQQRDKAQHESELEQLRLYFEKKLGDAEKNYQEALTVLQQRLRGARGESAPEPVALSAVPEEASGGGGRGRLDPPGLHLEQHEASLHAHTMLEESPQCQVAAQQEGDLAEIWMSEQRVGLSEEPGQDLAPMCLRAGGDTAVDVDTVVAARVLALEAEHKVKLSLLQTTLKAEVDLLKEENRRLCEKLQREVCLKEGQEKGKHKSVDGHQEELRQAEGQIRLLEQESREREAEWEATGAVLQRDAEEQLSLRPWGLRRQAEADRQSVMDRLARRETEMRQLQEQQAAQILDLEGSLMEQQGRLRQLELGLPGDESPRCSQCGREPGGSLALTDRDQELTTLRLQEDCALQLMLAQNRFLEQRKEISEKFAAEQDAFLREAREKHASELQLLQDRHQQHIVSLRTDLEARHQADVWELKAAFEREQRALSDTRVAELQAKHAADIQALETRHLSSLDAVESRHLSEVQALRDEHRRALEQLRAELEEQLPQKCSCHHAVSTRELETLQRECDGELQSTKGCPRAEPRRAHQGESHSEKQGALRERKERPRPASAQAPSARPAESEVASLQLREKDAQILQLEERVLSLRREVEGRDLELETLQRRRDRENQEGTNLIAMLRSDVDLSHGQRMALQDALRRLLGLFGETLQAAVALRSRIGERVGLCLEDEHPPDARLGDPALTTAPAADELWPGPDGALPELDATLPACSELSSVAEVSSHVRESFLLSPERALECEEPVRGVYRSLGLAVDSLLDMVLDSARQLEEARQIHARLEKEFSCKDEEVAQVVREHRALLERLEEESVARTRLTLELHKAEGVIEGFKVEKAGLQEALGQKEAAERDLVVQLESLSQQLQRATRQQAELEEENAGLWHQKDAAAAEAQAREAALRREVENASREQVESRRRCEKDRRALLAQVGALEAELEEQLSRQQATAVQASELCALRQQVESLDKHLRGQRQFMDEQAVEREHEREEFQQEIRRLEEQLRRAARPQPRIPSDGDIELLQEKLKEKSDEFDELVIKKELADRQVLIQEEEIKHLKETNADTRRKVAQLQEELEELRQDKVASQGQARSSPLLSTQRTAPEEDSGPSHPVGHCPERPEVPLEALQSTEVLDLKEQLEKIKGGLVSEDEALQLNVTLDVQSGRASTGGLEDESAAAQVADAGHPEVEELKSIIESLQEKQARLQKDRADEVEQLHEVIGRLQRELSLGAPVERGHSLGPAQDLRSELQCGLLCLQAEGAEAQAALQAELHAALAAKDALSQRLAEQERRHGRALEALQQRLRAVEAAATRRLAQLGSCAALQEAEAQGLASQVQEWEAALKAKDVEIAQRDLELEALSRRTAAHSAELEALQVAVTRLRRSLEQTPLGTTHEPPKVQRLRAQCVRLSRRLQALNQRFLGCQEELDKQQAHGVPMSPSVETSSQEQVSRSDEAPCGEESEHSTGSRQPTGGDPQRPARDSLQPAGALVPAGHAGLPRRDGAAVALTLCQRQLESELLLLRQEMRLGAAQHGTAPGAMQDKEELLEDCKLRKVDLITQVKQLQENLNRLVHSMKFQNIETEEAKSRQPLDFSHVSEDSLSDSCSNSEGSDTPPPDDTLSVSEITWGLTGVFGNQGSWVRNEMPGVLPEEKADLRGTSLCLHVSSHGGTRDLTHSGGPGPLRDALGAGDLSSWSSPEVVRKDSTLELLPSLPVTPCSEALSQRSLDTSLGDRRSTSLLQADPWGLLCSPGGSATVKAPCWTETPSATDRTLSADHHVQRVAVEKDIEDFITTSLDSQDKSRSPPPVGLEGKLDGSGKSDDGTGCAETLDPGLGGREAPTASPAAPWPASGSSWWPLGAMEEQEVWPKHMEAVLQMVRDESRHILALSEYRGPPSALSKGEPSAPLERFLRRDQGLWEAGPALEKGEKGPSDTCLDWREQFLQVVQEAFAKEREMLAAGLQPRLCGCDPGAPSALSQNLEKVAPEQGDLQETSSEHLHLSDRSSLLSEIQALRAQLRRTHLQNQEKLQQLCAALTSTEARGSRREHQLRRQVELLAYKVEQEKCIASGLQKTLSEEQERANDARKLLAVEQSAVRALRAELCECRQDNERLLQSLGSVQREVLQLRSMLDSKENDLRAALQELEGARGDGRALQSRLEQEQLQHLQREAQSQQALGELRSSLEKQRAQNSRLSVALEDEQTAKDNLRKELQIESSRCEALLAQERGRLSELRRGLQAEQGRTRELSEALQHERLLTEQLSRRTQACAHPAAPASPALLQQLQDEKARGAELQAALEEAQQHTAQARELEAEARARCEELRREKERELELQRQRHEHKIQQLQRTARELQAGEAGCPASEAVRLQEQQQGLEKIRQQLLCAAGLLTSFVNQTVDRTMNDWMSSNEKAVTSLLRTLEELKSELSASGPSPVRRRGRRPRKMAAEDQAQLLDVLLKDNASLTQALRAAAQEKAGLRGAAARLERALAHHVLRGCVLRPDRSARKRDRTALQSSPGRPDAGLPTPAAREEANAGNVKMEKLYLRCLRAESFRKALIYQKKYLLLLIGGFQDSEQETLSMIAHLGVFPSKADKIAPPRPFTKFRTAVRVVIAISRLRFLVRKWQEVDRKGTVRGRAPRPGVPVPPRRRSPPETSESPPTRDVPCGHARNPVPRASPHRRDRSNPSPASRSERSLTASQDPERSLTEYIHHLETIQQRLGGVPPDRPSQKSCRQRTKQ